MACGEPFKFEDVTACKPLPIQVKGGKGGGGKGKDNKGKGKGKADSPGPIRPVPRTIRPNAANAWTDEAKVERALKDLKAVDKKFLPKELQQVSFAPATASGDAVQMAESKWQAARRQLHHHLNTREAKQTSLKKLASEVRTKLEDINQLDITIAKAREEVQTLRQVFQAEADKKDSADNEVKIAAEVPTELPTQLGESAKVTPDNALKQILDTLASQATIISDLAKRVDLLSAANSKPVVAEVAEVSSEPGASQPQTGEAGHSWKATNLDSLAPKLAITEMSDSSKRTAPEGQGQRKRKKKNENKDDDSQSQVSQFSQESGVTANTTGTGGNKEILDSLKEAEALLAATGNKGGSSVASGVDTS